MTQLTVQDFEQMERGSNRLSELYAERGQLFSEFSAQLSEIDEQIRQEMGGEFPGQHALSVPKGGDNGMHQRSTGGGSRTPRARNHHPLDWFILVVMYGESEEVSEATIVEKVLDMAYQTNAKDFSNSVYTTLHKMASEKVVAKGGEARHWTLMAKGRKDAQKAAAEWDEMQDE